MKRTTTFGIGVVISLLVAAVFLRRSEENGKDLPAEPAREIDPQPVEKIAAKGISERKLDLVMIGKIIGDGDWEEIEQYLEKITLKREDWEAYMATHGRDVETLTATARHLNDPDLFAEIAEHHGQNPLVITAILEFLISKPEQAEALGGREEWVRRLKEVDPENGIAALYGARMAFENGDPVAAFLELQEVESALIADFYVGMQMDQVRAVYTDAGWADDDAFILGQLGVAVPFLNETMKMSTELAAAMDEALEAGNDALAQDLWRGGIAAARLVRQVEGTEVISALVSNAMENVLYEKLDAFDLAPGERTLVVEWMAESEARMEVIREFDGGENFSSADWRTYWKLVEADGEMAAMRWANDR